MEDWKELSLQQLKRLAKGRAGRIVELQMELKIIEGIIESKIRSGDFSGKELPTKPEPKPVQKEQKTEPQQAPQQPAPGPQEPLIRPSQPAQSQPAQQQSLGSEEKKHPGFENKEEKPKSLNPHAFREIE
jgi:hypothetical protein